MSSKQFTRQTFAWLRQINRGAYPPVDLKVALELTEYFNEKDQGGRAFPSYKTLGDAIGVSERTVIRAIDRMRAQGDLRVIPGKPGRGHPNQYWMLVKPVEKTSTATQVFDQPGKPAYAGQKTCKAAQENHLKNHLPERGCYATPSPEGERVRASRDEMSPPAGSPPLTRLPAEDGLPIDTERPSARLEEELAPAARAEHELSAGGQKEDSGFRDLLALWRRGHACDDTPKAIAMARQAYERACKDAEPDEIIEGARAWIAAADAPRYLPALPRWLAARGWEKPPPTKASRAYGGAPRGNGARQYGRKPSLAAIGMRLAAEYAAERREREREREGVS
jgi:Helix-turn-helix domain